MSVKMLGVPYDVHSSFLRGPAAAPQAVRDALTCGSANWCTESGLDLEPLRDESWFDLGDLVIPDHAPSAVGMIRNEVTAAIADGSRILSIGGDHLVTWPIVQAVSAVHDDITIVHFDAHPDLYDELDGDRYSHACPFARIMEEGRVARLLQFGIRTMTPHQRDQADRFGVEVHELRDWDYRIPELSGPVYISIDVDALDPAFAPGISHNEPGGMTTRQLLDSLYQIDASGVPVVGADVVEINPSRDVNDQTAMVGAKLIRELLGMMIGKELVQ
ncbi:MAG: agmatinase [Acidimicrobiales bacterium]|jgi:arginase|nr:agmatinase [Acidimicrobiales bacterium]MDG2218183.1 agmatinase [Acidimicrobiales bacterium]